MKNKQKAWYEIWPIAHRGLHSPNNPENTLGAFRAAIEADVAIELDVHCTLDDKLVIIHDSDTMRATGTSLDVTKVTYEQLRDLRLFKSDHSILTLEQVLTELKGQVPLLIEVKTGTPGNRLGRLLLKALDSYDGQYAVMSFDPRILLWLKQHAPSIPRGLLCGTMRYPASPLDPVTRLVLQSMVSIILCKPQFIAYDVDATDRLALRFWQRLKHLPLLLWPVLTDAQKQVAAKHQANIIFENYNSDPEYRKV